MTSVHALLLAASFGLLAACNTIGGAGEDIEAGGAAISDTAEETEREMSQ